MRRRDDADVYLDRLVAADARDLAVFQHAQQLGLQRQRHVADFVEEQGAAVGIFETALAHLVGAGEGAGLVAEQLVVEQALVQGGAVQGGERLVLARAVVVQRLGDQLLARAVFAEDQHGGVGRGGRAEALQDLLHAAAVAHDAFEAELLVELALQLAVGPVDPDALRGLLDDGAQLGHVDRLGQVVGGALLDGLDGRLDVAVPGDDDDLGLGRLGTGLAQDRQAVEVGHLEVGEDDVEVVMRDPPCPLLAAAGDGALVAFALQRLGKRFGVRSLVVDDQHFQPFAGFGRRFRGRFHDGSLARGSCSTRERIVPPNDRLFSGGS